MFLSLLTCLGPDVCEAQRFFQGEDYVSDGCTIITGFGIVNLRDDYVAWGIKALTKGAGYPEIKSEGIR